MSEQPKHTPGPLTVGTHNDWCVGYDGAENSSALFVLDAKGNVVGASAMRHRSDEVPPEVRANAHLFAAAPAMELALALICVGAARIEQCGTLVEFCFDGLRYSHNGDWTALLNCIGWDKARAATAKAKGTES